MPVHDLRFRSSTFEFLRIPLRKDRGTFMRRIACCSLALILLSATGAPNALAAEPEFKITPDVIYGHKAGMALTFDVIHPKKPNGAGVLFMVSGAWISAWAPPEGFVSLKAPAG